MQVTKIRQLRLGSSKIGHSNLRIFIYDTLLCSFIKQRYFPFWHPEAVCGTDTRQSHIPIESIELHPVSITRCGNLSVIQQPFIDALREILVRKIIELICKNILFQILQGLVIQVAAFQKSHFFQ